MEKVYSYGKRKWIFCIAMGIVSLFLFLFVLAGRAALLPTDPLSIRLIFDTFVIILLVCAIYWLLYPFVLYSLVVTREIVLSKEGVTFRRRFRPITIQKITDLKVVEFLKNERSLKIVGLTPNRKEVRKIVLRTLVGKRWEEFKEDLHKIRSRQEVGGVQNMETKMKNLGLVAIICLLLIGVVVLSGCIGEEKPKEEVPEGVPTIEALLLQNAVTLDGKISGNEWDDAGQLSLTFTCPHGESSLTYPGTIYLKHDGANLWICIRVQDDDENKFPEMSDYAAILFDANGDGDISHEDDSAIIYHGEGPKDLRPDEEEETWRSDTEFGGSSDVAGESGWAAEWYTYEMRKPLSSGDVYGYDITISPEDTILSSSSIWDAGEATMWSADAGSFYIKLD